MCHLTHRRIAACVVLTAVVSASSLAASGQTVKVDKVVDKWVTVTGVAAGTGVRAKDEALAAAQRKAAEQACGTFIKAQTKTKNFQTVYDRIIANTVGYVREHEPLETWTAEGKTFCKIRARVSTQRFAQEWAVIAGIVDREGNPRVIVAVVETVTWANGAPVFKIDQGGTLQTALESFLLSKKINLMDRETSAKVTKRDVMMATIKNDAKAIAALGAQFKADIVIMGRANAKYSQSLTIADTPIHQYIASLNIRVVQCDSAKIIVAENFSTLSNTLQRKGGEQAALAKLGEDSSPKVLAAIIKAWNDSQIASRTTQVNIMGMDHATWKDFKAEVREMRGVQAVRLREIAENVVRVDIEYRFSTEILADWLTELKTVKLTVKELTAARLGLAVTKPK